MSEPTSGIDSGADSGSVSTSLSSSWTGSSVESARESLRCVTSTLQDHSRTELWASEESTAALDRPLVVPIDSQSLSELTPWQRWLIDKERLARRKALEKAELELAAACTAYDRADKLRKHQQKADQMWRDWVEQKSKLRARQTGEELLKRKEQTTAKQMAKEEMNRKAVEAYEHWLLKKEEKEQQHREKELAHQKKKDDEKKCRKEEADEAYARWLAKADSRLPSHRRRVMFDVLRCPPEPSFCNPNPWVHPEQARMSRRQRRMHVATTSTKC